MIVKQRIKRRGFFVFGRILFSLSLQVKEFVYYGT